MEIRVHKSATTTAVVAGSRKNYPALVYLSRRGWVTAVAAAAQLCVNVNAIYRLHYIFHKHTQRTKYGGSVGVFRYICKAASHTYFITHIPEAADIGVDVAAVVRL